jgi:c-di-GMP-binding flagellar brake protein YcgR
MEQTNSSTSHISNIEDYEKYLLHGRGEIIQKLRQLGKSKCLVTAHIDNDSLLTAVVDVLSDNDLLVLDYGANDKLNQKMLDARRVICSTKHQGITAQFTATNIKKARLKGDTVLACPLPDTLLWVQRREAYRVRIPRSSRATCEFTTVEGKTIELPVLDISATGIAISNEKNRLKYMAGDVFQGCKLHLADFGEGIIDLEIRNQIELPEIQRVGCTFLNSNTEFNSMVQRYIHMIDALQRKTAD